MKIVHHVGLEIQVRIQHAEVVAAALVPERAGVVGQARAAGVFGLGVGAKAERHQVGGQEDAGGEHHGLGFRGGADHGFQVLRHDLAVKGKAAHAQVLVELHCLGIEAGAQDAQDQVRAVFLLLEIFEQRRVPHYDPVQALVRHGTRVLEDNGIFVPRVNGVKPQHALFAQPAGQFYRIQQILFAGKRGGAVARHRFQTEIDLVGPVVEEIFGFPEGFNAYRYAHKNGVYPRQKTHKNKDFFARGLLNAYFIVT